MAGLFVSDLLVFRHLQQSNEIELRATKQALDAQVQAKEMELRAVKQALDAQVQAKETELRATIQALDTQVQAKETELRAAKQALDAQVQTSEINFDRIESLQTDLAASTGQLAKCEVRLRGTSAESLPEDVADLLKKIELFDQKEQYEGLLSWDSVYPRGLRSARIGMKLSDINKALEKYNPEYRENWISIDLEDGPFTTAAYYIDTRESDPKVKFIVYWFRDQAARDAVVDQALCHFGSKNAQRRVDDTFVKWENMDGFHIDVTHNAYRINRHK